MTALKAFSKADWHFRLLLLRVIILIGFGRLTVLMFPFKRIARWIGEEGKESSSDISEKESERLVRLASAIFAVSKYTSWQSNCFAQALCAHWILKGMKVDHTTYFGVKKEGTLSMKAHAWLRVGQVIITGKKGHKQFTILGRFAFLTNS
ncbi:lasso peptide biosynthesis B2 protein [Roseivirga sp. E12]|uniref:lasso peptide biosynthesis B2 protein n=1 Tax=Roseivirga sp. E12 TaxID=2819237 RepID=UPI001ABBFF32|nr:lasso peptide biosynthesis B2 protein [Roseivirga sp. E12]MBO3699047.1 lasso peptide biosynthesis B2 protein [Roseivirga sp. E12]